VTDLSSWPACGSAPERRSEKRLCDTRRCDVDSCAAAKRDRLVDHCLPLSRLDQQIEEALPTSSENRRQGIGAQLTDAAEQEARARGWESISRSVSQDGNVAARSLYVKLGYLDAGVDPVPISGVITLRGRPFKVDDTLVYLTKPL
jgi:GNAT superfamily N-acetyltransferase